MTPKIFILLSILSCCASSVYAEDYPVYRVSMRPNFYSSQEKSSAPQAVSSTVIETSTQATTTPQSNYRIAGRSPYRATMTNADGRGPTIPLIPSPQLPNLAPSAKPVSVAPVQAVWQRNHEYYQATTVSGRSYRRGFDCGMGMCPSVCGDSCGNVCGGSSPRYYRGSRCYTPSGSCGEKFPIRIGKCPWESARLIHWEKYAQGEYVGPARTAHVAEYRLRVDDELDLVYRLTREEQPNPYALNVGDEVRIESTTNPKLNRDLLIQPDGTITLLMLGQVHATGLTVPQLRDKIQELYRKYYKNPAITVTPLRVNSKLDDLRNAVDSRFGQGGQNRFARVTPDGTISLPAVGVVQAQGLTLAELRVELREAYRREVEGIEVIPVLVNRAPRYIYILGEVALPGRYEMTGPTTLMQAIAMAGSWNVGAYLKQIVVFRRGHDWRLKATMLDIRPALYGRQPCPPDEIWLSDSDVIVVPKNPILVADEFIDMVFTRGIYGVFPMNATLNFVKAGSL